MKKIMCNDRYGLTESVLSGRKTQTRRIAPKDTPLGCWKGTEAKARFQVGEIVAIALAYSDFMEPGEILLQRMNGKYKRILAKNHKGWNNKLFVAADIMPHQIRITNVRVELLQDISDEDCIKEGIMDYSLPNEKRYGYSDWKRETIVAFRTPREAYADLIDKVSGKGTWKSNPFVFVYEFELVK